MNCELVLNDEIDSARSPVSQAPKAYLDPKGFRGSGFRGSRFGGLGFRGLGFSVLGFRV